MLGNFISAEQDKFIKSGRTVKGGKTFVRRERMPLVPKNQIDKYYTFSDDDVINLIALRAKEAMSQKISNMKSALAKSGYVKSDQPQKQEEVQHLHQEKYRHQLNQRVYLFQLREQDANSILKLLDL